MLAHLSGGGPDIQYGVAFIDGSLNDRTNYVQMFYGNGVVPATPAPDELTGYNTYQYVLPAGTVPVRFLSFDVTEKEHAALLTWEVDNESILTNRYEIERSLDGISFDKVAMVLPTSATNAHKNYQFIDHELKILKQNGRMYYRIKQVDVDGRFVYTEVQSLLIEADQNSIVVYPNPTNANCKLILSLREKSWLVIQVYDESGRQVFKNAASFNKGTHVLDIRSNGWSPGVYTVRVNMGGFVKVISFIKM